MACPVTFSHGFGSLLWVHKPVAQGGLPRLHVREDCIDVKVELRCQHFADSMDFSNNGVFPHGTTLP
jgi:hypothetical protein